nr:hypothetical protein [uncultured Chitinophaga sp.]
MLLPSPSVAAIQRYGNWPLGSFTGTPSISIPLFEINSGDLTFPVTLAYNSGGVRINDVGSEVGIGWTLRAGGVITRTMMGGQVDENTSDGFWARFPITFIPNDPYAEFDRINLYSSGKLDAQPDLFNYNVSSLSGRFAFDNHKNVYEFPYTGLKITPTQQTSYQNTYTGITVGNAIVGFTLTDHNGVQYQFFTPELSVTTPYIYKDNETSPLPPDDYIHVSESYIFNWQLTSIISANKNDTIRFEYEPTDTYYWTSGSSEVHQSKQIEGNITPVLSPYITRTNLKNQVRSQRLKFIRFGDGYLQFYTNTDRKDVQQGKRLDSIALYNTQNIRIRAFNFDYQYLYNTGMYTDAQVPGTAQKEDLRLMLRSVREAGSGGLALPPYLFEYEHSKGLPSRLLSGGDIWGFANGITYTGIGDSLNTRGFDDFPNYQSDIVRLKKPDYTFASQASLKEIRYPSGGRTTFEYEPHFRTPVSTTTAVEKCEGNINAVFTGVQFAPPRPNDPDAPAPPKFRISGSSVSTYMRVSLDANYNSFPPGYYFEIRDSATNNLIHTWNKTSLGCDEYTMSPYPTCVKYLTLAPGTYYIYPKNDGQPADGSSAYCKVEIPPFNCHTEYIVTTDSIAAGGIRLKQALDVDNVSGKSILKVYEYSNGVSPPWRGDYYYERDAEYYYSTAEVQRRSKEKERVISFNSHYPILDMAGGFVGYGNVKEIQKDPVTGAVNGYTLLSFDNQIDDSPAAEGYKMIPYPPFTGASWTYGRSLGKRIYRINGTDTSLISEEKRSYSNLKKKGSATGEAFFTTSYLLPGSQFPYLWNSNHHEYQLQEYVKHSSFSYISAYSTLDSVVMLEYGGNGPVIIKKEHYTYDTTTTLLKQVRTNDSRGDLVITNFTRPGDYGVLTGSDAVTTGIKLLQQQHIYAPEIEMRKYRANADGTNQQLLSAFYMMYRPDVPEKSKVFSVQGAIPLGNFVPSGNVGGSVVKDDRYEERISFNQYDSRGNLLEQQKTNDAEEAYFWGYKGRYPVARVIGANYNTAKQFVDQKILDNPIDDAQLRAEVNKLRNNLPGAMVTTYSYIPLKGISSETDPSGITTYYEYDSLGRLKLIRDHDGKVLKQFDYQYQQPTN